MGAFRGEAAERTWLIGILRHKVLDALRLRQRETSVADADELIESAQFDSNGRWKIKPQGIKAPIMTFMLHLLYGAILGAMFERLWDSKKERPVP